MQVYYTVCAVFEVVNNEVPCLGYKNIQNKWLKQSLANYGTYKYFKNAIKFAKDKAIEFKERGGCGENSYIEISKVRDFGYINEGLSISAKGGQKVVRKIGIFKKITETKTRG